MSSFTELADLAAARVGGRAVLANDEFFAAKENLLKPGRGIFIPDKFTPRGKWMDGWETRRRRTPGHDWCVVKLGLRGRIRGADIDTNHFIGNFPEHASLEAADLPGSPGRAALLKARWTELVPKSALGPGAPNLFEVADGRAWTHVRLNIYPDGGVARLRVYGEVAVDWSRFPASKGPVDLAAIQHGGLVLAASDQHFGSKENMIMPGRAPNMGDGWETRRRRGPGHDWAILRLGCPGSLESAEVDTNHFKGNYPESCSLEGCLAPGAGGEVATAGLKWEELLSRVQLKPSARHAFKLGSSRGKVYSHVRLNIYPDGGISRLRLYGKPRPA